jgi:hypothetical protein
MSIEANQSKNVGIRHIREALNNMRCVGSTAASAIRPTLNPSRPLHKPFLCVQLEGYMMSKRGRSQVEKENVVTSPVGYAFA